jgi:hypothetical protein
LKNVPIVDSSRDAISEKVLYCVGSAVISRTVLGRVLEGELFAHPAAEQWGAKGSVINGKTPDQLCPEGLGLPSRGELVESGGLNKSVVRFSRTERPDFAQKKSPLIDRSSFAEISQEVPNGFINHQILMSITSEMSFERSERWSRPEFESAEKMGQSGATLRTKFQENVMLHKRINNKPLLDNGGLSKRGKRVSRGIIEEVFSMVILSPGLGSRWRGAKKENKDICLRFRQGDIELRTNDTVNVPVAQASPPDSERIGCALLQLCTTAILGDGATSSDR